MLMSRRMFSTRFIAAGAVAQDDPRDAYSRWYSLGSAADDPRGTEHLPAPFSLEPWQLELVNENDLMWFRLLSMRDWDPEAVVLMDWSRANNFRVPRDAGGDPVWTPPAAFVD